MSILENFKALEQDIDHALKQCHRESITLIAVSKTRTIAEILDAIHAGIHDFGENYVQEALPKITALLAFPLTWHFIGPIQHNKVKRIATHFSWVHSVSTEGIAQALNNHRPNHLPPLNICLQVNIDRESTKSGVLPEAIHALITRCLTLPHLHLRGLMIIPKPHCLQQDNNPFVKTASLLTSLNQTHHLKLDTLSMGMSADFDEAIKAGSTCIRIGTRLFGKRVIE